jgi:hypothetical protein
LVIIQSIGILLCSTGFIMSILILMLPYWQVARISHSKSIEIGLWAICNTTEYRTVFKNELQKSLR